MNADMPATAGALDRPLVSVVLTTRDRPRLLPVALACYRHQTCPNRELIVVDDGDRVPADEAAVEAAGGRLIRVPTGLPLGEKLNRGASQARGWLCQKMDDDDWYGPDFLRTMVDALLDSWRVACRPTVAFVAPFLFFDLARWEVSAGDRLHDRSDLLRHGYARVADPDAADAGWVPAFAIDWALEVLGWKNPASPARLRRCVDVIARYAGA